MSYDRRSPPDTKGMVSLKVDNLTYRTTIDDLRRVFEKYGEIGDIYIPRDRFTRESRGFAFVRYHDKRDAEDAIDILDGTELDGREIRVQTARYGRPAEAYRRGPPRGGRRRGYGGGGYGGGSSYRSSNYRRRSRSRSRSRDRRRRSYSRSRSSSRSKSSRSRSRSPAYKRKFSRQSRSPRQSESPKARSYSRSPSREKSRSCSGSER